MAGNATRDATRNATRNATYLPGQKFGVAPIDPATLDPFLYFRANSPALGSEEITNGDFASATGWNLDTNASIAGGKLVLANSSGLSYQSVTLTAGASYEVVFTVSNYSFGTVRPYLNGANGTAVSANGTYTETVVAGAANNLLGINPSGTMDLDNISIKEVSALGNITTVGGSVSEWRQVTTTGSNQIDRTLAQGTANKQPLHDNTDKHVTFDGSDDDMELTLSGSPNSITQAGIWISATKQGIWAEEINATALLTIDGLGPDAGFPQTSDVYAIALLPNTITDEQIEGVVLWLLENTNAAKATATTLGNYRRNQTSAIRHIGAGIDTSNVTSFGVSFYENSAATSFPLLDTSSSTLFHFSWFRNSSLTEFPLIDTSIGVNFFQSWQECSTLLQFPLLDVSKGENFQECWRQCSSLTSFPSLDVSSGTTFANCWRQCSSLTSFPALDMSSATNLIETWRLCSGLTSFGAIDVSNVIDFSITWYGCNSLTSFPQLNISKGENFRFCWGEMSGLTSFPSMSPNKGQNFSFAWQNCTGIVTFPANFFDSWNPTAITSGVFNDTWDNGNSLTATSVENILVSIAASGKHGTADGESGGGALADAEIDIDYNASSGSLTTATNTAITALKSRSWGVKINGVLQ